MRSVAHLQLCAATGSPRARPCLHLGRGAGPLALRVLEERGADAGRQQRCRGDVHLGTTPTGEKKRERARSPRNATHALTKFLQRQTVARSCCSRPVRCAFTSPPRPTIVETHAHNKRLEHVKVWAAPGQRRRSSRGRSPWLARTARCAGPGARRSRGAPPSRPSTGVGSAPAAPPPAAPPGARRP